MFFYLGKEVKIVDDSKRYKGNRNKSWEYGYNEDIDVVIISKDRTLGPIFDVWGIRIGLPEQPKKADHKNAKLNKKDQKWRRDEIPKDLNELNWHEPRFSDFVDSQFYKREHGEWITLNGKEVWLVGNYWFFLQEYKEGSAYSSLRIIQNELMMYWEACVADDRCYGMQYVKNRRFGASALACSMLLNDGTFNEDKILGMVSKKGKDAKKLFNRLVRAFKRLSPYFKVETDGNTTPKTELVFSEQNRRRKIGEGLQDDNGLNSSISWHNTEINAMDGEEVFRSVVDEGGKYPKECPIDEYWGILKTSHTIGMDIVGKSMHISTVNSRKKGGQEFLNLWNQSDATDRNANGQTQSGLYRIFIDAALGLQGFYDEYGFSIVEDPAKPMRNDKGKLVKIGADTFLKNTLKSITDPVLLNEEIRKFPRKVSDAFRDESQDCVFNLTKLMEQIEHNEEELDDDEVGNTEVTRGNFVWKDGVQDTTVIWKPDPIKGRFWIANGCHPKEGQGNSKVQKFRNGIMAFAPLHEGVGCFGIDPFNRSQTTDGRGSNGAIHLYVKDNTLGYPNSAFILEYIDRPSKIEFFYEDVIMAMVYFSMPILPEMSSDRFSHFLIERGYRNFVLNNPFKTWKELTPEEKKVGGINAQNAKIREAQFQVVNTYIEDYIGVARDGQNRSVGDMGYMPFTRTLNQWKDTDPDNRTDFDAYISSSLALIGCQSRTVKEVEEPKKMKIPFKRYDNSGLISQAM
jgi:hypothetical protein